MPLSGSGKHAGSVSVRHLSGAPGGLPQLRARLRHLLEHGIVCRRQDKLRGLDGCLRIAVGTPAENDALIAAILALR